MLARDRGLSRCNAVHERGLVQGVTHVREQVHPGAIFIFPSSLGTIFSELIHLPFFDVPPLKFSRSFFFFEKEICLKQERKILALCSDASVHKAKVFRWSEIQLGQTSHKDRMSRIPNVKVSTTAKCLPYTEVSSAHPILDRIWGCDVSKVQLLAQYARSVAVTHLGIKTQNAAAWLS